MQGECVRPLLVSDQGPGKNSFGEERQISDHGCTDFNPRSAGSKAETYWQASGNPEIGVGERT